MSEEKMVICRFCKKTMPDNAGHYYHEKDCERKDIQRRIDEARARGFRPGERERLEREMFRASYTGD